MKSKFVKIAALLMVAVLASSCVLSSTLAYYKTSSGKYTDTARVAKWTWNEISVTSSALFKAEYTVGEFAIASSGIATTAIVAPGTSGAVNFKVSEAPTTAPEVPYQFGWTLNITGDAAEYLKFGLSKDKINSSAAEVCAAVAANMQSRNANEVPGNGATDLDLYWEWAFDFGTDSTAILKFTENVTVTASFEATQVKAASSQGQGSFPPGFVPS